MFEFMKAVNVTNTKNVLCQIPRAVVSDWGLKVGDTLELVYTNGEIRIRPSVYRGSYLAEEDNRVVRTTTS